MRCLNLSCNYAKTQVINLRKTRQGSDVLRRRRCRSAIHVIHQKKGWPILII